MFFGSLVDVRRYCLIVTNSLNVGRLIVQKWFLRILSLFNCALILVANVNFGVFKMFEMFIVNAAYAPTA